MYIVYFIIYMNIKQQFCIYIYIYTHSIYTHTHTHIYIHIHICTVGTESIQTPLNFSLFVILQPFAKII